MNIYYFIVLLGVFVASCSQLFLKKSAVSNHKTMVGEMLNTKVIISYMILFGCVGLNIYCLGKGVNLKDIPILEASGYVFVPLLSWGVLKERLALSYLFSLTLIILGVIIFYM